MLKVIQEVSASDAMRLLHGNRPGKKSLPRLEENQFIGVISTESNELRGRVENIWWRNSTMWFRRRIPAALGTLVGSKCRVLDTRFAIIEKS